jgi:curli production assembly/transport component CsgG
MASANVGVKLYGEHNLNFSDNIDYIKEERDDYYYRFGYNLLL